MLNLSNYYSFTAPRKPDPRRGLENEMKNTMIRSEYAANTDLQPKPVTACWMKPAPVRVMPVRRSWLGRLFVRLFGL